MHRQKVLGVGGIGLKLLPKTEDMVVNCPSRRIVFISPDLIEKFFSRNDRVRRAGKKLQQLEFLGCQCEPLARARCFHTREVNRYAVKRQDVMGDRFLGSIPSRTETGSTAAHRSTHASEKLFRTKRFRDVIIRAELQQKHLIFDFCVGAQHHDRYRSSMSLERTAKLLAWQARKL